MMMETSFHSINYTLRLSNIKSAVIVYRSNQLDPIILYVTPLIKTDLGLVINILHYAF
jgi:hypothetical protein